MGKALPKKKLASKQSSKSKSSKSKSLKSKPLRSQKQPKGLDYRSSGVDIDAGNRFVHFIGQHVRSTYSDRVLAMPNGFAGMFSLAPGKGYRRQYRNPVLVACTDGVGTKLKVAFAANHHQSVGVDLVAMSINDLLCLGAEPLFFLDYFACSKLDEKQSQAILLGIIQGCKEAGAALLGGESAEMPGLYAKGEYDLAGFGLGVVEEGKVIDGSDVKSGDLIIGLPSNGLHSNGFSLARKALFKRAGLKLSDKPKVLKGKKLSDVLLKPTRIYAQPVSKLLACQGRKKIVKAMAHITGGGLIENVPRVLPKDCKALIDRSKIKLPPIFKLIQEAGKIEQSEMYRVFNMGIGFTVVVAAQYAELALQELQAAGERGARIIGEIVPGKPGLEWTE